MWFINHWEYPPAEFVALLKKTRKCRDIVLQIPCGKNSFKWKPHWTKMSEILMIKGRNHYFCLKDLIKTLLLRILVFFTFQYKRRKQNTSKLAFISLLFIPARNSAQTPSLSLLPLHVPLNWVCPVNSSPDGSGIWTEGLGPSVANHIVTCLHWLLWDYLHA